MKFWINPDWNNIGRGFFGGVSMAGIGLYLKQVREQQGYTLEEMNRITNIHIHYLKALEQDRFDLLPSPFYAKAFLRTYAKSLGIDAQPLLEQFDQTILQSQVSTPSSPTGSQFAQHSNTTFKEDRQAQAPFTKQPVTPHSHHSLYSTHQQHAQTQRPMAHQPYSSPTPEHVQTHSGYQHVPNNQIPSLPPSRQEPHVQETQNLSTVSQTPTSTPSSLSSSPNFGPPLQQPLAPRRVALEKKKSEEKETTKRRNYGTGVTVAIAVSALISIGSGVYYYFSEDAPAPSTENVATTPSGPNTGVNADELKMPILEHGDISENPYEGQLYLIQNVDKLEVVLKAKNGESTVLYAPTVNDKPKELTLKVGQVETLDTAGKNQIWFRLGTPSNVEVSVNGQIINTEAQDTEKSYRVQLKK